MFVTTFMQFFGELINKFTIDKQGVKWYNKTVNIFERL